MSRLFVSYLILTLSISCFGSLSCEGLFNVSVQGPGTPQMIIVRNAFQSIGLELQSVPKFQEIVESLPERPMSPHQMDVLATKLVLVQSQRRSVLTWLREEIFLGVPSKKLFETRYLILNLKEALETEFRKRGLFKENSALDQVRDFKNRHRNKYQFAKLILFNSLTYHYLGVPLYFPSFNLISNMELSKMDLFMIRNMGLPQALTHFKETRRWSFRTHQVIEQTPRVLILAMAAQMVRLYFTPIRDDSAEILIPEQVLTTESSTYRAWIADIQESEGRTPDISKNVEDLKDWEFTRGVVYQLRLEYFQEAFGRPPDFANPQDVQVFQEPLQ